MAAGSKWGRGGGEEDEEGGRKEGRKAVGVQSREGGGQREPRALSSNSLPSAGVQFIPCPA